MGDEGHACSIGRVAAVLRRINSDMQSRGVPPGLRGTGAIRRKPGRRVEAQQASRQSAALWQETTREDEVRKPLTDDRFGRLAGASVSAAPAGPGPAS